MVFIMFIIFIFENVIKFPTELVYSNNFAKRIQDNSLSYLQSRRVRIPDNNYG